MKNILSYANGTKVKGSEIKEWIRYQISNQTSHLNEAKKMEKYMNIDDESEYYICKGNYQASERYFQVINA